MIHRADLQIRDPFVLPLPAQRRYALFGTTDREPWATPAVGFDVYLSVGDSLDEWEEPRPVFRPAPDFWATHHYWAPEVHEWQGRFFMFASFRARGKHRATQLLVSDTATGSYVPYSPVPATPPDWDCLDGTLFVDAQNAPWLVFCHEWQQIGDGGMYAVRLADDLSTAIGEPLLLFRASSAPWAIPSVHEAITGYVTDGPFMHRTATGALLMLWSTFGAAGYGMTVATSASGEITGEWTQLPEPLIASDAGHGMLFRDFGGALRLALHQPNKTPRERPQFLHVVERGDRLEIVS